MKISPDKIYLAKSPLGGRGMFARVDIKKGQVVETAPYVLVDKDDCTCALADYKFAHSKTKELVCLGYGAMYNHAKRPNLEHRYSNRFKNCLDFIALRDIKSGEELLVSYGDDWWAERGKKEL
ncbi:MAG: SET domain-containing protein [Candidatus Komeilibacteria bacterium]